MTERQKTLLWKKTQAQRNRFNKQVTKLWDDALMAQIQPVIDEIGPSNINQMETRVDQLIRPEVIEQALIETIQTVSPYFAVQTRENVEKAMPDQRQIKQEIPTDEQWINLVRGILGTSAGERITAITDSSKDEAVKIIKEVLAMAAGDGMGVSQTSQLLRDELNERWGDITTYRAARIARTETAMASNLGSLAGAESAGVPLQKVWLSTRDSRTRRTTRGGKYEPGRFDHYGTFPTGPDGEARDLKEAFTKTGESLQYPGDYAGSAANVINCRCTMFYEPVLIDEV